MKNIITISFISLFLNSFSQEIELIKEFIPNSVPQDIVEFDGKLFFSADDGINGRELWSSNGTTTGTTLFKDILTGGASNPEKLKVLNGKLYFIALETLSPARKALYVSDGTVTGTIKLTSLSTNQSNIDATNYFESYNNLVYFKNDINGSGSELWVTNGTVAGTSMLIDINPGSASSFPDRFYEFNGELFFNADDGQYGKELWKTNGTVAGTSILSFGDVNPTTYGPRGMIEFNSLMFYEYNGELWASTGSPGGTLLFKTIHPNFPSNPKDFIIYGPRLYFSAQRNGLGNELFTTDGTVDGTVPVLTSFDGYECNSINHVLGELYYSGKSDNNGQELWKSQGTDATTREVKNINAQNGGLSDGIIGTMKMIEVNGLAFFPGTQFTNTNELFVTDGTETGTHNLEYIDVINYDGDPNDLTSFQSTMFFGAKFLPNGALYKIASFAPFTITTSSSPLNGGTTSGGGVYDQNESVTVTAVANANFTFTNWTINGTIVSTSATFTFPAVSNVDLVANFTPSTSQISENSSLVISIYPNPVNEILNFELSSIASLIEIKSLDGKLVFSQNISSKNSFINVAKLESGIYMYSINFENGSIITSRFIKN